MKYYRVEPLFDLGTNYPKSYRLERRKWGIWRPIREFSDRSEAFMHLDSLNRGALLERERIMIRRLEKLDDIFHHIELFFERLRR